MIQTYRERLSVCPRSAATVMLFVVCALALGLCLAGPRLAARVGDSPTR